MRFIELVRDLRRRPDHYLECCTAIHLGAFLNGYGWLDISLRMLILELADCFDGPEELDVFSRAYLTVDDARRGVDRVLEHLEQRASAVSEFPTPPLAEEESFMAAVGPYLRQKRSGVFLGEPTVTCLHHFVRGFLVATAAADPAAGERQARQLADFGRWLGEYYHCGGTQWHRVLRVYGMETRGIFELPALWDEFLAHPTGPQDVETEEGE